MKHRLLAGPIDAIKVSKPTRRVRAFDRRPTRRSRLGDTSHIRTITVMPAATIARTVFTVVRHSAGWTVEREGFDAEDFHTREEAMASATRHANASQNAGHPAQIRVADDPIVIRG